MKTKILLLSALFIFCYTVVLNAQKDFSGNYSATGYFFHPTTSRTIELTKTITKIGTNTYQVNYVGDVPGWGFQLSVNATNHLVNWVATGDLYPAPQSGFMSSDNPGGIVYTGPSYPGTGSWVQSTYNNTYDPATKTFYMHYGYASGASGQNGYNRQIYEKYVLAGASLEITSVTPLRGTSFSKITIKGKGFLNVDPLFSIFFGNAIIDSASVVSDNTITAWVGAGASGDITITDIYNTKDTFSNFIYNPVPPVQDPQWTYVGKKGFSQNRVYNVSAACGTNNIPYVTFVDSASRKTRVMKYNSNKWTVAGSDVSEGKSSYSNIVLTRSNIPVIAYIDSTAGGNVTVKKFISGNWVTLGNKGFAPASRAGLDGFSTAIDNADTVYILSMPLTPPYGITVFKFDGSKWVPVGAKNFALSGMGMANIAIDKTSNIPYVVFDDVNTDTSNWGGHQATVMRYNGKKWITVGTAGFTSGKIGIYYPNIEIDDAGNVLTSMQEDDGFERQSVYKFKTGKWNPVGYPRFSKGRAFFDRLSIDHNNNLFALFGDVSYNKQGTVMQFIKSTGKWDTVGARGFLPYQDILGRRSLFFDTSNTPMIVFSDKNNSGRISVMKFEKTQDKITQEKSKDQLVIQNSIGIEIFPNPAQSVINFSFNNIDDNTMLQVLNTNGQIMMQKKLSFASVKNTMNIDISKLPAGVYILSVKNKNGFYSKQFIKE